MATIKQKKLNLNQEEFCQLYAGGGQYFGNGVWSYILAYKLDVPVIEYKILSDGQKKAYDIACAATVQLLRNIKIQKRCNELLDALIKDEVVDRELARVIMQNNELPAKVSAIKEYNLLRNRIKQPDAQKVEIIFGDEQVKKIARRISNGDKSGKKPLN